MRNGNLMIDLTQAEMLALWKELNMLEPSLRECSIEREDGTDIDSLLTRRMEQWYAHTLATAPSNLLPVADVSSLITATTDQYGVVKAVLPNQVVRPIEVRLVGWRKSVTEFLDPDCPKAVLQSNEMVRGSSHYPVAVAHDGHLMLYSLEPNETPRIDTALCVVRPANGHYVFSAQLTSSIVGYGE